jgi:hypothetical protein
MSALKKQKKQEGRTSTHSFTLLLRGRNPLEHLDALYEAGCDDALFGEREGVFFAEFDREAKSFPEAVESAIRQVESAVRDLKVVRVEPDDLVNASAIAARVGRTRESVRLLIGHERGPGDFPPPVCWLNPRTRLWRWADVARWFAQDLGEETPQTEEASFIAALNAALELRGSVQYISEPQARKAIAHLVREETELLRT